jgi:hypothetical protein
VEKHGEKSWKKIATQFGNRSDVQCRYHYQQMQRGGARRMLRLPGPPAPSEVLTSEPEIDTAKLAADARILFDELSSEFALLRDRETWRDGYLPDPFACFTTDPLGASLSIDD